ncbi:MAG: FHA domain-containing protein [Pirellulales bacterium]
MPPVYWCRQRLIVTIDGPEGRQVVATEKPFARIGCHQSSEIVLAEREARLRSLYLHATENGIYCASLLPPWLDRPRFNGWIVENEALSLGCYRITASFADGDQPPDSGLPDLLARGSTGPAAPELEVSARSHDQQPTRRRLNRCLTLVGRSEPANLCLGNRTVSRIHCVLYWDGLALWVVDLLSGNGTRLEGRPVETALLGPGGSLELGDVQLRYVPEAEERTIAWSRSSPSISTLPQESSGPIVLIAHQRAEPPSQVEEQRIPDVPTDGDKPAQAQEILAPGRAEMEVIPTSDSGERQVEMTVASVQTAASLSPSRESAAALTASSSFDGEVDLLDRLVDRQSHMKRTQRLRLVLYGALVGCGILVIALGLASAVWAILKKA